jgi:hypothetical protein
MVFMAASLDRRLLVASSVFSAALSRQASSLCPAVRFSRPPERG